MFILLLSISAFYSSMELSYADDCKDFSGYYFHANIPNQSRGSVRFSVKVIQHDCDNIDIEELAKSVEYSYGEKYTKYKYLGYFKGACQASGRKLWCDRGFGRGKSFRPGLWKLRSYDKIKPPMGSMNYYFIYSTKAKFERWKERALN